MAENVKFNEKAQRYQDTETGKFVRVAAGLDITKFDGIFKSINQNMLMQTSWLESLYNENSIEINEAKKQTSLLETLVDLKKSELDLTKEYQERSDTKDKLRDVPEETSSKTKPGKIKEKGGGLGIIDDLGKLGIKSLLGAGFLAPFVFSFAKGFLSELTDGLIELTPDGVLAALRGPAVLGLVGTLTKAVLGVEKASDIIAPIGTIFSKLSNVAETIRTGPIGKILSFFGNLPGAGIVKMFGRLVWPLSIIMGAFDAVEAFRAKEGSMLEKIGAGIGGFLGDIIGAPLDLLKNVVGWILGKFGWEKGQELLSEFSFEDLIGNMFEGLFGFVDNAINWVMALFTWDTEKLREYDLSGWILDKADEIVAWVKEIFDFLPSVDEIKNKILDIIPVWLGGNEQTKGDKIAELNARIDQLENKEFGGPLKDQNERANNRRIKSLKQELAELTGSPAPAIVESTKSVLAEKTDSISDSQALQTAGITVMRGGDINKAGDTNNSGNITNYNVSTSVNASKALNHSAR